jgi:hypothetical protein
MLSAHQNAARGVMAPPLADCGSPAESGVISHPLLVIIRRSACGQKGASRHQAEGHHQARGEASITGPARTPLRGYEEPAGRPGWRVRTDDLPKDSVILRTAAQHNAVNVGVYASVLRGGSIRRGNAVTLA